MYPDAPIYCLYGDKKFISEFFPNSNIHLKFKIGNLKLLLPFFPSMIENIDLSDYDLVISTGSIFSKGLILRPKTFHINYCHSPTRQVWDLSHQYRHKLFQHVLRIWDRNASTRVDRYVANSRNIQERIRKYYHRDSLLIYPPVQNVNLKMENDNVKFKNYFLIVSRLFKHKNVDIAVKAFNKLGWELTIIGHGPEYARLKALAGPTVHLLGYVPDSLLTTYYSLCTAFILPQEEDFGIAPVEALMHGKPVLALRAGGALEYVQEGINGTFFDDPHEAVLADGVRRIRDMQFNSDIIKRSAEKFSWQKFQSSFSNIINQITR